jgi:cyclic beta-1,2-glucan synthetase
MAFARLGDGAKAIELLTAMNPVEHAREPGDVQRYKVEPYVAVADIYALKGQVGRGGWSWYTGSAGWMYRVWIEEVLGLTVRGDSITVNPVIAPHWHGFRLRYRRGATSYEFTIENPDHVARGIRKMELDGRALRNGRIPFQDDGVVHLVRVVMGAETPAPEPTSSGRVQPGL